jgi:hypothetical protein
MTAPNETTFTAETFLNEHLAAGTGAVDAVVTICASGAPSDTSVQITSGEDRAEVIIVDCSGSMYADRKMAKAKDAAAAALDCLDDGVAFAVIAGNHEAHLVYPSPGDTLPTAGEDTRAAAKAAIKPLDADGGTVIGSWLDLAKDLFDSTDTMAGHAILLTDGRNEHQRPDELARSVEAARGLFRCDCRGVGTDWVVDELRRIADALLGTVALVAGADGLEEDFRAIIEATQATTLPKIKLRLRVPKNVSVESVRQVSPVVRDLTSSGDTHDERHIDYLLGDWAPGECRDYHVRIQCPPREAGRKAAAGWIRLVLANGDETTETPLEVVWTDDHELSTRIEPHVAHYTGQEELAKVIQEGLKALEDGSTETATVKLGRAAKLAKESGHLDTLKLLERVVDIDDADSGTVKLRPRATKSEKMDLDAESVKTQRFGKRRQGEGAGEGTGSGDDPEAEAGEGQGDGGTA